MPSVKTARSGLQLGPVLVSWTERNCQQVLSSASLGGKGGRCPHIHMRRAAFSQRLRELANLHGPNCPEMLSCQKRRVSLSEVLHVKGAFWTCHLKGVYPPLFPPGRLNSPKQLGLGAACTHQLSNSDKLVDMSILIPELPFPSQKGRNLFVPDTRRTRFTP